MKRILKTLTILLILILPILGQNPIAKRQNVLVPKHLCLRSAKVEWQDTGLNHRLALDLPEWWSER